MIRNIKQHLFNRAIIAAIFDNEAGWKKTADGKGVEMKDGNPIWLNADGTEATIAGDTITRLNSEAAGHRKAKEAAEAALAGFKDIKDPAKALEALKLIEKLDQKKLIDAGEVDKLKEQITAQFKEVETALKNENATLKGDLNGMKIGNIFANSEFVRESIAVPLDMFKDSFSKHFKVNDKGEVEAFDRAGNRLGSKSKIGDYAGPEEALQLLVDQHPQKDTILKPANKGGAGNGGGGGARGGGNVVKRSQYDAMPIGDQQATMVRVQKGELSLVD